MSCRRDRNAGMGRQGRPVRKATPGAIFRNFPGWITIAFANYSASCPMVVTEMLPAEEVSMFKPVVVAALVLTGVAACSPAQLESEPVTLQSPQGPVVCQLYTKNMLDWDRSISRPEAMNLATADALCQAEGLRWKQS